VGLPEPPREVSRRLPAVAASVREARAAAIEFARSHCTADERLLSDIALCVSEAVGNVVAHAYSEPGGEICLRLRRTRGELIVEIGDRGTGTSAGVNPPGMGVGIQIVQALSDATFAHSPQHGHRVTMRFGCTPSR